MLYATRDAEGKIIGISDIPSASAEPIENDHKDVKAYFSRHYSDFAPDTFLDDSDLAVTRILDDLVDLLVQKNLIMFTELPNEAQKKLISRRIVRSLLKGDDPEVKDNDKEVTSFLSDEENLL